MGEAVCFPDTFFSKQPDQSDLRGLVIGAQDLPYLDNILNDVMESAVPDPWPVKGPWINTLHKMWGETWVPKLKLGDRIGLETEERIRLDQEQMERLEDIKENDRVLIKGGAGTGKTLLARELAIREASNGYRVLLLCFTDALGSWLKETITHPGVTSFSICHFAADLLNLDIPDNPGFDPSEFWKDISLRAAVEGVPKNEDSWDCVIVDEGQDLGEDDWELVNVCAREDGRLWVFSDEKQAFWEERRLPEIFEHEFFKFSLRKPYRCPPAIQNICNCYAGSCDLDPDLVRKGIEDETIRLVTSSEQRLSKQVGKEINRLLGEGLKPHEIAVISVRGKSEKENICHQKELGRNRVVPATDPEADSQIISDTFLRFKGLERPAVIVTDLRLVSDLYETRMHIAVSRATSLLRIVAKESEMRKDPRLAQFL